MDNPVVIILGMRVVCNIPTLLAKGVVIFMRAQKVIAMVRAIQLPLVYARKLK